MSIEALSLQEAIVPIGDHSADQEDSEAASEASAEDPSEAVEPEEDGDLLLTQVSDNPIRTKFE